ncbi:PIN domain-containing protein [Chengkuizengella sediminis]|uniref:PIN domain-containing protein n=1 Tax=Chengkuizengella sediminis TaxID=1885917 RepID=UPI00138A4053|nr:PIN domain-containing protein [Chengkuizengella sediminis]NDI37245.1 DUF4935 domain-containing protein [Chengkuizengella sediminis]
MVRDTFIDTDIFINLANGIYKDEDEILSKLEYLIEKRKINLLIPDIVIDEWEGNKQPKIREALPGIIANQTKNLRKLKPFLETDQYDTLNKVINELSETNRNKTSVAIENRIKRIEKVIHSPQSIKLPIIDDVKKQAVEMALKNTMPFKNNKNSIGDALNFLTCLEYKIGTHKPEFDFITNNKHDFSENKNHNKLHDDLEQIAKKKQVKVNYSINIGEKLEEFGIDITLKTKRNIERIIDKGNPEWGYGYFGIPAVVSCCGDTLDISRGTYINNSLFVRCPKCHNMYDTGVFFD